MTNRLIKHNQRGFAVIESLIVLVIILGLAGVGYYVYHRSHTTVARTSTSKQTPKVGSISSTNPTVSAVQTANTSTSAGLAASILQLTQQATQSDEAAYNSSDAQIQQNATSVDTPLSNVGGAYNASGL